MALTWSLLEADPVSSDGIVHRRRNILKHCNLSTLANQNISNSLNLSDSFSTR
jgi:hypothetical protein